MIVRYSDAAAFAARALPLLVEREAENNLPLGIIAALPPQSDALLLDVDGVGVALRTPPFNLIVSALPQSAIDALVLWLRGEAQSLPGVVGPTATARSFAAAWSRAAALPMRRHHTMRVFENRSLIAPRPPVDGGQMRDATVEDLPLILDWIDAFNREVGNTAPRPRAVLEQRLRNGDFVLWQTDRVVSMAVIPRRTPHGAVIGYVYTPPALRGRGYASACVAAMTQRLHDRGQLAFLFADVNNPTSNKIYQVIGFRPVSDFEEWLFDSNDPAAS